MGIAAIAADLLHTMLARRTHHAHHAHSWDGDFTRAYQRRPRSSILHSPTNCAAARTPTSAA
ncbi:hypothetical protein [Streptomyces noursei]|uniref:hypothetical protein n=1 Tax=Streptomyces noursei TaxID=1971 RepID=UPI0019B36867|nr:hypothetical protein [Streptomyces noursei]MCZ1020809.1 hypothetical protein [Streptomyces noursei]GGX29081.1 hypothetical protein GCM10010341_58190 [Streptomyces noursei]